MISRFPVVALADMEPDVQERIGVIAEKSGFVPNVFLALGHRPAELRAFLDQHDALMNKDPCPDGTGLTKAERELVVVATSGANHCTYCIVAHGAILRIRDKDPYADRVGLNPYGTELSPRRQVIVELALALTREPERFTQAHIDAAVQAGLTRDEVWDIGAITAFFAMSNRLASLMALEPNDEFAVMGR